MWTLDGEVKHNMDFATETLHAHIDSNSHWRYNLAKLLKVFQVPYNANAE